MAVGRYHSLVGLEIPADCSKSTAHCDDLVMALAIASCPSSACSSTPRAS